MKHVFYAGLALAALASCSQDETTGVDKTGAIGFRTSLGKTTRAEIKLSNLGSFNVTAFPTGGANYFTDLAVNSLDNGVTWNTASVYYWPAGTLNFTAYAPASINTLVSIDKTTQKITAFEPEQAVSSQKDVVASFNSGDKATYGATGVPMNFKHILSQIEVKAKCTNSKLRVKVKGVKLGAISSKGDFTFPQVVTNSAYTVLRSNWTNLSTPKAYMAEDTSLPEVTLDGTAKSIMFGSDNFMMIPQQLTKYVQASAPTGAYIAVLCRMDIDDGSSNYTALYPSAVPTAYAFAAVGIDTDWQPGKKYTYTLEFGDGGGVVPPNQDNPNPGGNTPVDPQPPFPNNPGDPILNNPIKFTVTVDNWADQNENISM
ncbi:fimbrillin family protein [Bacteroides heparinolyticus]|uniref:Fimbrillin family protein n=2 Tax=Prevotella heparinolytica TaxID=28113 RepID=A0A3P1ZUH1_9BACE|nr:fimbrillin family protein [Bacteroides heparinolyticus]